LEDAGHDDGLPRGELGARGAEQVHERRLKRVRAMNALARAQARSNFGDLRFKRSGAIGHRFIDRDFGQAIERGALISLSSAAILTALGRVAIAALGCALL